MMNECLSVRITRLARMDRLTLRVHSRNAQIVLRASIAAQSRDPHYKNFDDRGLHGFARIPVDAPLL